MNEVQAAQLDTASKLELLRQMVEIRRFEEKSAELYMATKIRGFLHLYIGEEAIAPGVMRHLRADDAVVATYREHGQALARGILMERVMAELYGKATGASGGRGGSMHIFDAETNFYGGNAIVGGGLPLAVGVALADKMQGRDTITACFFGEGALAEGEFHESANLAELWQLPVLFCCENNLYAMGTALPRSQSQTNLSAKAKAYTMPAEAVDGMDVLAVSSATERAIRAIRERGGPYFLEFQTYRFRAHSMYDPELYRDKSEVEMWRTKNDPIDKFITHLKEHGEIDDEEIHALEADVERKIDEAVAFAEASDWESVESLERFVYAEKEIAG